MQKGLFITFEGADGSGKTTQLNNVKSFLEQKGFDVVITREPGALDIGQKIRNILLHHDGIVADRCEMFLFLADRAQHVETFIKPAIDEGKIILCDRHTDSTIAYQGYGRGQDINLLKDLNKIAINGLKPDLTLLFDVSTEVAQERVGSEKDRMESAGIEFFERVRNGFLEIAKQEPERVKVVDSRQTIEEIHKQILELVGR